MADQPKVGSLCPRCGAEVPSDAPRGYCLKCLFALGTADADPAASESVLEAGTDTCTASRFLGDYELLEEIARGGMGVVYRARQRSLGRVVAVKMLLLGSHSGKDVVQRFRAEAAAAASLQHPNIVAVHEVNAHEGQPFLVMDFVEGPTIAKLCADCEARDIRWIRRAAGYVRIVSEAVHYAHERGILHRDLKPSNVLIGADDQPHVTDFGLAKRLDDAYLSTRDLQITLTGQVLGSPSYMSPEQAAANRGLVGRRSDIYSLGAVLYHLLTGRPPFIGETPAKTLQSVANEEPIPPRLLNPNIPPDLQTICLKCLEKEPARRYPVAQAVAEELGRFLRGEPIRARPVGAVERLWRWSRRRPSLAASILASHLIAAVGLGGILWQWGRAESHLLQETVQRRRAEALVTQLELQRAEAELDRDESIAGIAHLARLVRAHPTNAIASRRLLSALVQRDLAFPVGPPLRHADRVFYAEFSPDGQRVATASNDGTAQLWNARTGEPESQPLVHPDGVRSAHFSPDGQRLVSVADDFRARLWDAATGRGRGQPMEHQRPIANAQFSPDGRQVVTASEDGTARIWDAFTGEPLLPVMRHAGPVRRATFSPDGALLATVSDDRTAQLWHARTGERAARAFVHLHPVTQAEFSPDGKWLLTVAWTAASVWDVDSGALISNTLVHGDVVYLAHFHPDGTRIATTTLFGSLTQVSKALDWTALGPPMRHGGVNTVQFSPEGARVLSASSDNTVRLWDADTGRTLSPPMQHGGVVRSGRFSPDGCFAVTASSDKTARIWDLRLGGACVQLLAQSARAQAAWFSPDGARIAAMADDGTAWILSDWDRKPTSLPLPQSGVIGLSFSPDGSRIAAGSLDGTVRIWNARDGRPLTEPIRTGPALPTASTVYRLAFSPNGQWLATANERTVTVWDAHSGAPRGAAMQHPGVVNQVCFSPDSERLLACDPRDDLARIWEVETGRQLLELRGHRGYVFVAEFSPDGRRIVTGSEDGTARVWSAATGQALLPPLRHRAFVKSVHFSPDGKWLVTASIDATAQVWDSHTGRPLGETLRHRGQVNEAAFSPDGTLVATASDDGTVRIWDALSGRSVAERVEHPAPVRSVQFSPDGRWVLGALDEHDARIWEVPAQPRGTREAMFLAELAEAFIGKRLFSEGALEDVPPARLGEIRRQVGQLGDSEFRRTIEWFFADRSSRTISPQSGISMPDFIASLVGGRDRSRWRQALMLSPSNRVAAARLRAR